MGRSTVIRTATLAAGAVDASASPLLYWRAPCQCVIAGIHLITSSSVAKHASNKHTTTVTNLGDSASGSTGVATAATSDTAIEAGVPWAVGLSGTAQHLEIAAGDVLRIAPTEAGTAGSGDLANVTYQIDYYVGAGVGCG